MSRGLRVTLAVIILLIVPPATTEASHVLNNGLPERPPKEAQPSPKVFDWHLYVQGRFTHTENSENKFALRRLKLNGGGHFMNGKYFAQGIFKDGNNSNTDGDPFLQEAWVQYGFFPWLQLMAGQFKPSFGMERFTSDARMFFIDRTQATNHLVPNGNLGDSFTRDYGLQLDGGGENNRLYYALGLFEGEGANNPIRRMSPLLSTRLVYWLFDDQPVLGRSLSLHLGGAFSVRWANDLNLSGCCPGPQSQQLKSFDGLDTRWNLELGADWETTTVRAEYFLAYLDPRNSGERAVTADGFYVQVAQILTTKIQAAVRFQVFDPDRSIVTKDDLYWTTLGLNYYFKENRAKVMVNYIFKQERDDAANNDTLQVQLQYYLK